MLIALHQECHYGMALRSTAQPAVLQAPFNRLSIHRRLEYI
jgi:hypothetical protein